MMKIESSNQPLAVRSRDAARVLGVTERCVFRLAKSRKIHFCMIGEVPWFPLDSLQEFIVSRGSRVKGGAR